MNTNYAAKSAEGSPEQEKWRKRTEGLLQALDDFFIWGVPDVMYEVACERSGRCNRDQRSFRAYLARFMALTVQFAPWTADYVIPKLEKSAFAAARQCDGGTNGRTCGLSWMKETCDGNFEHGILGQTLSALEVVQSLLILDAPHPVTAETGGTSKGDENAGLTGYNYTGLRDLEADPITTGEKVGAAFLTILVTGVLGGFAWFMITDRV